MTLLTGPTLVGPPSTPHAMTVEPFIHWLTLNPAWLGLSIALIALLECLALAGVLIPGVVLLFAVSSLAGAGALSLPAALAWAYGGALVGDGLSYAIGRHFHQRIRRVWPFRQHPEWISHAEQFFNRYGIVSLLIGRFIGPLRPILPMVAGMLDMPRLRFALVSLVAAAGWSVAYIAPGWLAGAALQLPLPEGFWPQALWLSSLIITPLAVGLWLGAREYRYATLLTGMSCAAALLILLTTWPHFQVLDPWINQALQRTHTPNADVWFSRISALGDTWPLFAGGLSLTLGLWLMRARRQALFMAVSVLTATGLTGLIKLSIARQRPPGLGQTLEQISLPSGHSVLALTLALSLGVLLGRGRRATGRLTWLLVFSVPALPVLYSRLYLSAHWPTDVAASLLLAAMCVALSQSLCQRITPMTALTPRQLGWALLSFIPGWLALLMLLG